MQDNEKFNNGLTGYQKKIIKEILSPFANQIERVGLFGSRATGLYRDNSDIDMVIYGELTQEDANRLWSLFDASLLAVKVDVIVYSQITYAQLKAHVDAVMQPLFEKEELIQIMEDDPQFIESLMPWNVTLTCEYPAPQTQIDDKIDTSHQK